MGSYGFPMGSLIIQFIDAFLGSEKAKKVG
jgi:hypothetical protein